jgi:UDP-glucuronate 4-epimerase
MRYVVTGAAGFVGSHVCAALLERSHDVDGVDAYTDYYDPSLKRANAARLARHDGFRGLELDLARADFDDVFTGADAVIHLAAQPGVRLSWSEGFACTSSATLHRSGCWRRRGAHVCRAWCSPRRRPCTGNATERPITEDAPTRPFSPYGVTKLAMEHLASAYGASWSLSTVVLRYFTL